jgi:BirA family biotin operon repressor/biotin-[acetyl-CoA-carboxylase] ligase
MKAHPMDLLDEATLTARLGVPRVALFRRVTSTMDEAHRLAEVGAEAGTLVIADEQTAGRGRGGRHWSSASATGLWLTLLERPESASGLDVLSLRIGIAIAPLLERLAKRPVEVKWPNDLLIGRRKLAGVLIEARWREQRAEWVAIGVGINIEPPPDLPTATGLGSTIPRAELLAALVPALRAAAAVRGPLSADELAQFARRDFALGRRCAAPAAGVAGGITEDGALIIVSEQGSAAYRGGSLEFAGELK